MGRGREVGSWVAALLVAATTLASPAQARSVDLPPCDRKFHDTPEQRRACKKEWTVLVYMAADNDLTPYAYWDLHEMEAGYPSGRELGGSSLRADYLVQLDTTDDRGLRRIHIRPSREEFRANLGVEHYRQATEESIRSPIVMRLPEDDGKTEAQRFEEFLEWGFTEYPSERTMVVVWGHGQGWAGAGTNERVAGVFTGRRFGGLAFDDSSGGFLDIPSLSRALRNASDAALDGRPIDVYASDACLMQMLEVANELTEAARYVVGSTQTQNYLGLPYRKIFQELNAGRFAGERRNPATGDAADEAYLLARMIPRVFQASMQPNGLQGRATSGEAPWRDITMSAISTEELRHELLPALERLSQALLLYLDENPIRAVDLQYTVASAPSVPGGAQELGSLLAFLRDMARDESAREGEVTPGTEAVEREAEAARAALLRSVPAYALGTRYRGQEEQLHLLGFRAVSVWVPANERDFKRRFEDFRKSSFYKEVPSWNAWLGALFAPGS